MVALRDCWYIKWTRLVRPLSLGLISPLFHRVSEPPTPPSPHTPLFRLLLDLKPNVDLSSDSPDIVGRHQSALAQLP